MALFTAAAFAAASANEVFDYNRKSYKFDREQQIEREVLRMTMQIKRFELFREDIRDLVRLTVDRMDVYHVVGALFLQFCIVILTKGRIQAAAPPFLLSLFLLTAACAFIYLLLAVWMSVHASIASHSFGTKLLTRFVRLPIPSVHQLRNLTYKLKEFEKQGIGDILCLPFQQGSSEAVQSKQSAESSFEVRHRQRKRWELDKEMDDVMEREVDDDGKVEGGAGPVSNEAALAVRAAAAVVEEGLGVGAGDDEDEGGSRAPPLRRRPTSGSASRSAFNEGACLLPDEDIDPIVGGDDLLASKTGARPDRHVQLFRILQAKWQCYDAYCRVCMSLGVNQMLQVLSYYAIAHTVVENQSPSTGLALVFMLQCCTVALGVFDLAGLQRREIIAVQVVGVLPCFTTAIGVAHGTRNASGELDPNENYTLCPLSFLLTVLWLELWLRISSPSRDRSRLPRRFRQVLFLDVFGDAGNEDPSAAEDRQVRESFCSRGPDAAEDKAADDEVERATASVAEEALERASSQLVLAQSALRRWHAVPAWAISRAQMRELDALTERLRMWGTTIQIEFDRCRSKLPSMPIHLEKPEAEVRPWAELSEKDRRLDPFAGSVVGPFAHDGNEEGFHYDVESQRTFFVDDALRERPDSVVLTLQGCSGLLRELEEDTRHLLEVRICYDLRRETKRQRRRREADAPPTLAAFPNLVALVNDPGGAGLNGALRLRRGSPGGDSPMSSRGSGGGGGAAAVAASTLSIPAPPLSSLAAVSSSSASSNMLRARSIPDLPRASAVGRAVAGEATTADPTYAAMAGKHARHFVPERLPWQLLSRMTRVLQLCWSWAFLMASLKELEIFKIDFGMDMTLSEADVDISGEAMENVRLRRRLCAAEAWRFERVALSGPPSELFRPRALGCSSGEEAGDLLVASAFALHRAGRSSAAPADAAGSPASWRLSEIARSRLPAAATAACWSEGTSSASRSPSSSASVDGSPGQSSCLLVAPTPRGLELWPAGRERGGEHWMLLPFDGPTWRLFSAAVTSCGLVAGLLPPGVAGATRCLLLAGFDGASLPAVALPLADSDDEAQWNDTAGGECGDAAPSCGAGASGGGGGARRRAFGAGAVLAPGAPARLAPAVAVPLPGGAPGEGAGGPARSGGEDFDYRRGGPITLHVEGSRGRLWAVWASGDLEAWDLLAGRSIGLWRPAWPWPSAPAAPAAPPAPPSAARTPASASGSGRGRGGGGGGEVRVRPPTSVAVCSWGEAGEGSPWLFALAPPSPPQRPGAGAGGGTAAAFVVRASLPSRLAGAARSSAL